jgi:L-ascorbate metabolism protein UlaG (beta-lactamase superfamily)
VAAIVKSGRADIPVRHRLRRSQVSLRVTAIGGPTTLLEYAGLRLLVDPTFDPPRSYSYGPVTLVKTAGPAVPADSLGRLDGVLVSHDHHPDNFDESGRALALSTPLVLTNPVAAERLGPPARGLRPYESTAVGEVRITAVPALHGAGKVGLAGAPVTGFVLEAADAPTVYVSGDNSSVDVVAGIAEQFPSIDVALLFAGAAMVPARGDVCLTMTAADAVVAADLLGADRVVVVHQDGWAHFTQGADDVAAAFAAADRPERLVPLPPGASVSL